MAGAVLALAASLAGCVAPEPPAPPPIAHPAAAATPAPSNVQYEAAPVPNRRMGPYVGDSVIRVAH